MKTLVILIFLFFTTLTIKSQKDTTLIPGDTMIHFKHFENGQLMFKETSVVGKDISLFQKSEWYYENGNERMVTYLNKDLDSSYFLSRRKNGTVDFQYVTSKGNYTSIRKNKKGEIIERITSINRKDIRLVDLYRNGKLKNTKLEKVKKYNKEKGRFVKVKNE